MADLAYPALPAPLPSIVQGRSAERYVGTYPQLAPQPVRNDLRHVRATTGTITDQVVLKTAGGEVPFVSGRVWLLRAADGYKAWEGWSDAGGNYTATGLEIGVEYVAVAIDPTKQHKTTGAGPVIAA